MVVSTALIRLASRFACQAAATRSSSATGPPGPPGPPEQAGLVERAPSPASRRAVSVRLTAAGHALIEATVSHLLEHEADLIDPLDAAERSVLNALLTKLEEALTGS